MRLPPPHEGTRSWHCKSTRTAIAAAALGMTRPARLSSRPARVRPAPYFGIMTTWKGTSQDSAISEVGDPPARKAPTVPVPRPSADPVTT